MNVLVIRFMWCECSLVKVGLVFYLQAIDISICNRMRPSRIKDKLIFTRIFKVFRKLPESCSDEGNLRKL